jgi:hypothetical protein
LIAIGPPLRPIEAADAGASGALAQSAECRERGVPVGLGGRRDEASDGLSTPSYGDLFTALDALQELREVRLRLEGPNTRHHTNPVYKLV